jgi:hypothetical protein
MRLVSKFEFGLYGIAIGLIVLKFINIFSIDYLFFCLMFALGILFFPFGFITLKHRTGTIGWANSLIGLSLSVSCIGICFKVLILEGANQMLLIGLLLLFISMLVIFVSFIVDKGKKGYYMAIFRRGFAFVIIGVSLLLLPSTRLVKIYYRNDPERIRVTNNMITNPSEENRKAYFDYIDKLKK